MANWLANFAKTFAASPAGKMAGLAALDAFIQGNIRPWMQARNQDILLQVDPASSTVQIDYVNLTTGHTTLRHTPPQAVNIQPVQLQPVGALWQNLQQAAAMNAAANAAQAQANNNNQNNNGNNP